MEVLCNRMEVRMEVSDNGDPNGSFEIGESEWKFCEYST